MLNLQTDGGSGGGGRKSKASPANPGEVEALQRSKKVLRLLSELSARIDETSGKCHQIEDLFSPQLTTLRQKIRENSASAILQSSEYISGPLDISWRKASYEVLGLAKKIKKYSAWTPMEIALIRSHLVQSLGFYQNLLLKLETGLDFQHENSYGFLSQSASSDSEKPSRNKKNRAVVKCLMFMGDLSRYQIEYADNAETKEIQSKIAKKYYLQCLSLDPGQGQPFNQLAALSSVGSSGSIIAVFYYLRCLTSETKFEAADGNMRKILEKSSAKPAMISGLLALFHNLLYEESTKNLSNLCRQALEQVIQDLYNSEGTKSKNSLYAILSLILIKSRIEGGKSSKLAMINAFLLAWFSHLTTKILADLHLDLFGPDSLMAIFGEEKNEAEEGAEKKENGHSIENGVENNNKKRSNKARRRKRRKRIIQDSADEDDEENQVTDSEDSEGEDNDINGNESESESGSEFLDDSESDSDDSDMVIEESKPAPTTRQMMLLFCGHPMLEAFSVCCQWLMSSEQIMDELSKENSNILFKRLKLLIKTLSLNNDKFQKDQELEKLRIDLENVSALDKIAFSEDKISNGMQLFKIRHAKIDFESSAQYQSKDQIGLARLKQMEKLEPWLCQLPQFKEKSDANQVEFQRAEEASSSSSAKMENMAQLWLQQEVKDLEHETKGKYSPYLVVDHTAMINHMFAIKDIVASKRFAIVVPTAVIQQLDAMKKSEPKARIAIRYLEKQFGQGNHWLRGQKGHECRELKIEKYPSRKEKESWHFFKILECCNHFLGQGVSSNVTLITANEAGGEASLLQVAKSQGINVETVEEFLTKTNIPKKKKKKKNSKENG